MKLQGLRVVDLSLFLPGPLMTQFMADHGAEVIKVESLREGEPNREIGAKRDGVSVYFANTHRGKKSLALNLKDPAGVEVLMRLAEKSDVLAWPRRALGRSPKYTVTPMPLSRLCSTVSGSSLRTVTDRPRPSETSHSQAEAPARRAASSTACAKSPSCAGE